MPRNPTGERSLLAWDSFCAYLTETVKEALQQQNIDVAVIASGLTPVLQPLDKCLNEPFRENMRRKQLLWMITGLFKFTPDGESAVKTPCSTLDEAVLEGDPRGDGEEIISDQQHLNVLDSTKDDTIYEEEPDIPIKEDEMDEEFDTESKDEP